MIKRVFDLYGIIYKFLGIKFKFNKCKQPITLGDLRCYTMAGSIHRNLEKYRGIFTDKDVFIVGGGPSLKYLDYIPDDCVKIGINRAYQLKDISFDYLFAQDTFPDRKELDEFAEYNQDTCVKFFGRHTKGFEEDICNSAICKTHKREEYILNYRRPIDGLYAIDISAEPFMWFSGTVFAVMQFSLFANARRIYLAGFDCTDNEHMFTKDKTVAKLAYQYEYWEQFKIYKDEFFKEIELVSVNPVNLKGMFKDVYTQSYVDKHPELLEENVEIIDKEYNDVKK